MKARLLVTLAALVMIAPATSLVAKTTMVEGAKIDSGLAELPNYSLWLDKTGRDPMGTAVSVRVPGESLDDGLGQLPHYSKWVDKTGRDPMGRANNAVARR